jgi:hypothetical protein
LAKELRTTYIEGLDEINPKIAKCSVEAISTPLAQIINCSITSGVVPDSQKIAKVIPIFKSGDKKQLGNYRPISILPYFSKFFEKLIYGRMMTYITANNILYKGQYGFRKDHSTFMAVMEMYDKISEARDNGHFSVGIFLDLSKAFDTVNHEILISKLNHYGIRGICLNWIRDYLRGRKQCVSYNGHASPMLDVKCGVPQGSILGPLLFLIYVNDISHTSTTLQFLMFADDTNLFMSSKSLGELVDKLNIELQKVNNWFKANKLSLNLNKTNYI